MNRKKKQKIDYPNIPYAIRPVPRGEHLPVAEPPKDFVFNSEMEEEDTEKTGHHEEDTTDPDCSGPAFESTHKLTQKELNDLVRDLEVPNSRAQLLASIMRQWKYLARKSMEPGHKNVKHHSLVESSRILLPPLQTKLALMKDFLKAMDSNGTAFLYGTCDKNSPCLVMPRYERVFSLVQTFAHFFVMRYLNASLRMMSRDYGMPSERWLQVS
jgi:hypothetical protein